MKTLWANQDLIIVLAFIVFMLIAALMGSASPSTGVDWRVQ